MDYRIVLAQQLGVHLRALRRVRGMTQTVVGNRIGLSQKRLSALELNPGSMTVDQLLSFAGALGFDVVLQVRSPAVASAPGTDSTTNDDVPPADW